MALLLELALHNLAGHAEGLGHHRIARPTSASADAELVVVGVLVDDLLGLGRVSDLLELLREVVTDVLVEGLVEGVGLGGRENVALGERIGDLERPLRDGDGFGHWGFLSGLICVWAMPITGNMARRPPHVNRTRADLGIYLQG